MHTKYRMWYHLGCVLYTKYQSSLYLRQSIKVSGIDHTILDSFIVYIQRLAKAFNIEVSGRVPLPTKIKKIVLLKSPHVSKQHRRTFAGITHRRLIQIYNCSDETLDFFMDTLTDKMPPGCMMSAT
ncbi:hypothetical protein SARC_14418, partial [Sphaeroforma arctica JP610]